MTTITLPWPPAILSPNARPHWARLAKAKKSYRRACWAAVLEQKVAAPKWSRMDVRLVFIAPDKRKRDRDNLGASMKAGLDGVADAWQLDDSRFARVSAEIAETLTPAKGAAHVLVMVTEHYRPWLIERGADGMPARAAL